MVSPSRLLWRTSLRGRFLFVPVIALIVMVLLCAIVIVEFTSFKQDQQQLKNSALATVDGLTRITLDLSRQHSRLDHILLTATPASPQLSVYSEQLLASFSAMEQVLRQAEGYVSNLEGAQREGVDDSSRHLMETLTKYRDETVAAVGLATSQPDALKEKLLVVDALYEHLVMHLQELLASVGQAVGEGVERQHRQMDVALDIFVFISITAILGTALVSMFFSKELSGEIGALIQAIRSVSRGETDVAIPAVSSGSELSALATGITAFRDSLVTLEQQKQALKENNEALQREVGERRSTEQALIETRARFQYMLNNSPTVIYTASFGATDMEVSYVSENASSVLGCEAAELLGAHRLWCEKLDFHDRPDFGDDMKVLLEQGELSRDYRLGRRDGALIWVHDSMALHKSEEGEVEVLGSLSDITEIKETEELLHELTDELASLAATLEDRVEQRTAELKRANERLARLSEAKSDFISIVSHDLRTPLTSIKLFSDIMLDDIDNIDRASQQEYLAIISAETDRLSRLISNILDFQKISAGKMQWNDEQVDLVGLVAECARPFEISFEAKGIEFDFDCEAERLEAEIDGDRLAQVAYNLLSNALKFTEEGKVTLSLQRSQLQGHDSFVLSVTDTGPGMASEQLEKIFEPFQQLEGVPNLGKGTGLGLYITRCVVDRYHGQIRAESVKGRGTTIAVEIPLSIVSLPALEGGEHG